MPDFFVFLSFVICAPVICTSAWSEVFHKVNGDTADTVADLATKRSERAEQMVDASVRRFKLMATQVSGNHT